MPTATIRTLDGEFTVFDWREAGRMTTNEEIGERLQAERRRLGMTQYEMAEAVRVSKTTQSNYETGARSPDAAYLALAAAIHVDVLYVLTGQRIKPSADAELVPIPRLALQATGGGPSINEAHGHYRLDALAVSRSWLTRRGISAEHLRAVQVRGSSMQGVLSDGDLVLVDQSDTIPRSGFVYGMRQGDEIVVKYCEMLPGYLLRISSSNTAFAPYDVDPSKTPDFAILGRVVMSVHEW